MLQSRRNWSKPAAARSHGHRAAAPGAAERASDAPAAAATITLAIETALGRILFAAIQAARARAQRRSRVFRGRRVPVSIVFSEKPAQG